MSSMTDAQFREAILETERKRIANLHPWELFLCVRAKVIDWMTEDGQTDTEIAAALSMDPGQVALIRAAPKDSRPLTAEDKRGALADTLWMPGSNCTVFEFIDHTLNNSERT